MAQIQKGTTFTSGGTVTDTNLNSHVDNATLLAGAITEQSTASSSSGNQFLVEASGLLKKITAGAVFAAAPPIGSTTPNTVAATTLTASGLATVGLLTSTGLATVGSLSVGGTSAHTGAATFASTAAFTGAATFDVAPNFNGGANLGNLDADPVVMTCTLSGNPILSLGTPVTAVAADKVLIQDASDASKLKVAAFPTQYVKAFVRANSSGTILGTALNVTSVVRDSQGKYTVTFTIPMTTATYAAVATSNSAAATVYVPTSATASCAVWGYFGGVYDTDFSLTIFEA